MFPKKVLPLVVIALLLAVMRLLASGSGSLNWTYGAVTDLPVVSNGYIATGTTVNLALGFAPPTGANLMVVKNTGLGFIAGQFNNLAQGQPVALAYHGVTYHFVANYYGGSGNDLVLQWASVRAMAWGYGNSGQLGNGSNVPRYVPTAVDTSGVLAGKTVVATSAGHNHAIFLCSDGAIATSGSNFSGQLGISNPNITGTLTPVAVDTTGILAGKTVIAVAAGDSHCLALCSDGTVASWGFNGNGQLGNGNKTNSRLPLAVDRTGVLAGKTVVAIAAGSGHSLALCSDGTMAAWGYDGNGQLGNNSTTLSSTPVAVNTTGVLAGKTVVAIAAGSGFSVALCSDGTVATWGENMSGQLGNNSTTPSLVPVAVNTEGALAGKTVVAVASGSYSCLALCSDGTLAGWGDNYLGELGNNDLGMKLIPVAVDTTGVLSGRMVTGLASGNGHCLILCSDGTAAASGGNLYGQVGDNTQIQAHAPVPVSAISFGVGQKLVGVNSSSASLFSLGLVAAAPESSPAAPVENWRNTWFNTTASSGDSADDADPNHNGITNFLEYALGGDPTGKSTGSEILPQVSSGLDNDYRVFFKRYVDRTDLILTVYGADAPDGPWTALAQSVRGNPFGPLVANVNVYENQVGAFFGVVVTDPYSLGDPLHPRRFFKLEASH